MTIINVKIFLHRSVGVLGCLLISFYDFTLFLTHEYIWAAINAALAIFLIYTYIKNFNNPKAFYGANYAIIFTLIFPIYHEYSNHKRDLCVDKYGLVYNKTRRDLGLPIIPMDWLSKDKWGRSVTWTGKEGIHGHEKKYIAFDSLYKIEFERDEYNFKGMNDTTRTISILYDYARGKSHDSIFYWYNLKDTTLTISRHQADSIFAVAKIRKDY